MKYHPQYGPSVPDKGWVPAPSYLLRRDRILRLLKHAEPGLLLEIGCGAGTLLHELSQRGFICEALETSPSALAIARSINSNLSLHDSPKPDWEGKFCYLLAFEVLEHIENDNEALSAWYSWLKPGGLMLISVPAHMRKWTVSDVWAGHFRRYERSSFIEQIARAGFSIEHCETYGFPLANLISPLREILHASNLSSRRKDNVDNRDYNNNVSGVARNTEAKFYPLLTSLPGRLLMSLAMQLQHLTAEQDWGTGYLVLASKKGPQ